MAVYPQICPNCGGPVVPVALDPPTAPWLCVVCARGWWVAELAAASGWDRLSACFGFAVSRMVRSEVEAELQAAVSRGTSAREDQLGLFPIPVLTRLASGCSPSFALLVDAALKSRSTS